MVENAKDVSELTDTGPFVESDRILAKQLANKMHGLTVTQYHSLRNRYMSEGKIIKGRQMFWLLFQNFQVDKTSLALYKSQQLRNLRLGSDLPKFLNAWQEHLSSMEENQVFRKFIYTLSNKLEDTAQ